MPFPITTCLLSLLLLASHHHALNHSNHDDDNNNNNIAYFKYLTSSLNPYFTTHNSNKCNFDADCTGNTTNCLNGECIQICSDPDNCEFSHCTGKAYFTSSDPAAHSIHTSNANLGQYLATKRCAWLLRNLDSGKFNDLAHDLAEHEFPPFIQLEIDSFSTNFGNDYLYVFDGDSVYSPLIAALSGDAICTPEPSFTADTHILPTRTTFTINFFNTSSLFLLFKSDIYSDGSSPRPSLDLKKPAGVHLNHRFSASCTDQLITNVQNTVCYNSVNPSTSGFSFSNLISAKDVATKVTTVNYTPPEPSATRLDSSTRRALHTSFVYKNFNYIMGGYSFQSKAVGQSFLARLNLDSLVWEEDLPGRFKEKVKFPGGFESAESEVLVPEGRYAHASVVDAVRGEVFMYGGVKYEGVGSGKQVTNELWRYDLKGNVWEVLNEDVVVEESYADSKKYVLPVAVSGHSMCVVENGDGSRSLLVFFGFSEYYGSTLNIIQEYNLGKCYERPEI